MEISDKVICINDKFTRTKRVVKNFQVGCIYTIKSFDPCTEGTRFIYLEEYPNQLFCCDRFITLNKHRRELLLKIKERINGNR